MPVSLIGMPRFQGNSQGYNFRPVVQAAESWRAQNNQNAMMQQRQQQFETGMDQRYDAMDDRQEQANAMLQARNKQQGLDNEFRNKQFEATQDYRTKQLANQTAGGYSRQPVYGTDANGRPVIMQLGRSGRAALTQLPPGVTPSTGVDRVDLGTEWGLLDKRSGQIVRRMPKNLAGAESQKALGKDQGAAQIKLPGVVAETKRIKGYIDSVLNHPSFGMSTGSISGYLPNLSASSRDFSARLSQLQGKAFVSAFERMKGAGAITELEGAKAGEALARLQRSTIGSDNFKTALEDFKSEMKSMVSIIRQRAGGGSPAAPQPDPSGNDPLGWR